ncbi:MAG: hypothetical protein V3V16_05145 [Melioribacteraceae bacterium]
MIRKKIHYLLPILIAILIFISNFLNTRLFGSEIVNFAVWFILSLFIFAAGWINNLAFGWEKGGKIVVAVIVATAIISVMFISFFSDYFHTENLLFENLILYSSRNILLGTMAIFGMSVCELLIVQRENESIKNKNLE